MLLHFISYKHNLYLIINKLGILPCTVQLKMAELTRLEINALKSVYFDPKHPNAFASVTKLLQSVRALGFHSLTRAKVARWLEGQPAYTLHKPVRKNFKRDRILTYDQHDMIEGGRSVESIFG